MGSQAFAALYQGVPTAAEGAIIKPGWLNRILPEDAPTEFDITWLALDTAFSEKETADESVITVLGYNRDDPDNVWIRDIVHGRYGFPDLIALLQQTQKYYRAKFLCIEQAASGQSLIQVLERETKIHIHKFKPLKSKTVRLQTVAPLYEAGRVKFIEGEWTDAFFKEVCAFPFVPHDDMTDSVTWGLTYFSFHLDGNARELQGAFQSARGRAGIKRDMGQFTELTSGNNKFRGRNTMFGPGSAGEEYRLGTEDRSKLRRSNKLKFDTDL